VKQQVTSKEMMISCSVKQQLLNEIKHSRNMRSEWEL